MKALAPDEDLPTLRRGLPLVPMAAGMFVVIAGLATWLVATERRVRSAREQAVRAAYGDLRRCLVGELGAGDSETVRFRRIQLGAMALEESSRRGPSGEPWPADCVPLAFKLGNALEAQHRASPNGGDLAAAGRTLAKALQPAGVVSADLSDEISAVFERAAREQVVAAPSQYALPPAIAVGLTSSELAATPAWVDGPIPWEAVRVEQHPSAAPTILVDAPDGQPILCRLQASIQCTPLPATIAAHKGALSLLGTAADAAAPLVFAGRRGGDGIYRSDTGERIAALYIYGAYVAADGAATVLGWDFAQKSLTLIEQQPGAAARVTRPDWAKEGTGNAYYSMNVLWDTIFQKKMIDDDIHIFARPIGVKGVGVAQDIGVIEQSGLIEGGTAERQHVNGCQTQEAVFARFKGTNDEYLSMRPAGGGFSAPLLITGSGGTLSCDGLAATAVHAKLGGPGGEDRFTLDVERADCTAAGCGLQIGKIEGMPGLGPHLGRFDALALGNSVLVVWQAGERGGVRMRLAVAGSLQKTSDRVIYDDRTEPGLVRGKSSLLGVHTLPWGSRAIVLLHTIRGLRALAVQPDGAFSVLAGG